MQNSSFRAVQIKQTTINRELSGADCDLLNNTMFRRAKPLSIRQGEFAQYFQVPPRQADDFSIVLRTTGSSHGWPGALD